MNQPAAPAGSHQGGLPYALGAYAFTRDLETAHRLGEELEAGMVAINHFGVSQPELPFGGIRASGSCRKHFPTRAIRIPGLRERTDQQRKQLLVCDC